MAILSMPNFTDFASARFASKTRTAAFVSALDGTTQTIEKPGHRWVLDAELKPMKRASAEAWLAFFANLAGPAGRFYAGDPSALAPRGSAGGTPLVNGASQTGKSLITDGWPASTTGVLLTGDYIAFDLPSGGRSLHKVTADMNSDGFGNATLAIAPSIRESPADNAAIITANATCVMRLADDDQATWEVTPGGFYKMRFTAIESFNTG